MDPDGQSLFRVTDHQASHPRYAFLEPSLSPDGEWIVFEAAIQVTRAEEHSSIYKVRSNGAELTRLTNGDSGDFEDRQPNWSPQGNRILFQRRLRGSDEWNLYTMSPSGTDVRRVTTARSAGTDASWSPDGRWIVYSSENGALPVPNVHIISADGGDPIRVTYSDRHEDSAPSWSPDGRWIAFESHVSEDPDSPSALWRIAAPLDRLR